MAGDVFKFRLERLRHLREQAERAAAINLADARRTEAEAHAAKASLDLQKVEARDALLPRPGNSGTVGELRHMAYLMEQLDVRVSQAGDRLQQSRVVVVARREELHSAVQGRRVLDRLKERSKEVWIDAQNRADREQMDELARLRGSGTDVA